jgi:SET domain-containing protein
MPRRDQSPDSRLKKRASRLPLFEVRHSRVHGYGVFAARRIRKGTTVIEYLGDRVSHDEADTRYEDKDPNDNHTFLFTVDSKIVIDGGVGGNEARYINHGCDPNCASTTENKRIYVEAIRTIQPGEELAYDYQIERDPEDPPNVDEIFACRCGAAKCRGSMLVARRKPRKRRAEKAATKSPVRKTTAKTARKAVGKETGSAARKFKKSGRQAARATRRAPPGRRGR